MNKKSYVLASLAVFAFIFIFDWIFHGNVMHTLYMQTPTLWRAGTEMQHYFPYLVFGQILLSFLFGFIFIHGLENEGIGEGFRYGSIIAALYSVHYLTMFATQPIPANIIIAWILGAAVEFPLAGMLFTAVYKPTR